MPESDANNLHSGPPNNIFEKIRFGINDYLKYLKLFSRNIRLYLLGSFLIGLTFSGYMLLLNLYLREQGSTESFIGQIVSGGTMGMAFAAIPAAILIRQVKLKPVLFVSTLCYGITIILLTWLPVTNYLVIFSFTAGVANTFYRVAAAPFFMRNSSAKERTYIFSMNFGVSLLASIIGSIVFGELVIYLSDILGNVVEAYRWTFVGTVGLGLLGLIPFSMVKSSKPGKDEKIRFSASMLRQRAGLYFKLFVPYFVVGAGAGLIIPFLNLYFRDRFDQPTDTIGYFFMAVNFTMLIGILAGPVLARKFGLVRTMVWTQLMSIPFMIILAYSYSLPLVFVAFLIRGALMNMGHPIGSNFSMEMVSKTEHAVVNALLMLGWTGSRMISTYAGGILIENHGYKLPLMLAVVLYIISSLLYYMFFRKCEVKTKDGYKVIAAAKL